MIPFNLRSFISRLRGETDARKIKWSGGAEGAYFCSHKTYTVTISHTFDGERDMSFYRMGIMDRGKDVNFMVHGEEDDFLTMQDLYSSVMVSAAGFENIENDFFD